MTARAVGLMADLTAMKALRTTRTLDFIKLEARLESLAVEEHVRPRI
ncbi:hypothetical protein [Legionella steelei]|nr:hypothetical protein [Legionella steelei]